MVLFLESDVGAGSSGSVSTWQDQSGLDNNATQTNSSAQPTLVANVLNGFPIVRFTQSSTQYFNLPNVFNGSTAGDIFVVIRADSNNDGQTHALWSFGTNSGARYPENNGQIYDDFGSSNYYQEGTPPIPINAFVIYNVSSQSGSWISRLNGGQTLTSNSNSVSFSTSPRLGYAGGNSLNGDVAEVLAYNRVLTSAERLSIGQYLFNKYQLASIAVPSAPTSLAATAISSTQVDLTWQATPTVGVTYTIERKTGSGAYAALATVSGNLGYVDTTAAAGTTYTYEVEASTYAGTSSFSGTASVTTPASSPALPLTGQLLWLLADAGIPSGTGGVQTWYDQSGQGNNATQINSAYQPSLVTNVVNGRPVVRFTPTSNNQLYLPNLLNGAAAGDIYVVVRSNVTNDGQTHALWSFGSNNGSRYPENNGQIYDDFGSTTYNAEGTPVTPINSFVLYNVTAQAGSWTSRMNGALMFSSSSNTVSFNANPTLGGSSGYYLNGDIAEVLVYNRALSSTERQTVGSYLFNKYQLPGIAIPPVPTSVAAAAISSTQVSLTWQATPTPGVTYTVERQTGSGAFVVIATVAGNLGFVDNGLTAGTSYTYQVQASSYAGSSAFSSSSTLTTPASAPSLPLNGQLLWLMADEGIPSGVGPLQTWYDQSGLGNNATQMTTANQPSLVTNVVNGRPVVRFTPTSSNQLHLPNLLGGATAGDIFVIVRSNVTNDGQTHALWDFGTSNGSRYPENNGQIYDDFGSSTYYQEGTPVSPISAFTLYNVTSQAGSWISRMNGAVMLSSAANTVAFNNSPLLGGSQGYYLNGDIAEVLVYNRAVTAAERQAIGSYLANKYQLTQITTPAAPTGVVATAISSTQVSLIWQTTPTPGVTYNIERQTGSGSFAVIASVAGNLGFVDATVTAGSTYTYQVQAGSYVGTSAYSAPATVTIPTGAASLPSNGQLLWLMADEGIPSGVGPIQTWYDQSGSGNNATQFNLASQPSLVTNVVNGRPVVRFTPTSNNQLTLPNLLNGATAGDIFVVVRSNITNDGQTHALWSFGSNNGSRYPENNGQIYDDFGSTTYNQEGTPVSPISSFTLYNVTAQAGSWISRMNGAVMYSSSNNTVGFNTNPLLGGSSGYYLNGDIAEVLVYNRALTSVERQTVGSYLYNKYQLPGTIVPPTPTNVTATGISSTQVDLTWEATPAPGVTYTVERQTGSGAYTVIASVAGNLGYIDTNLTPGTTYNYQVYATSYAGSSSLSTSAGVTTSSTAPSFPLNGQTLWLMADAGVPSGTGPIQTWYDQSGLGNNATQITAAYQPALVPNVLNGRPVVRFTPTANNQFNLPNFMSGATSGDIFIVLRSNIVSDGQTHALWNLGGSNGARYPETNGQLYDDFGSSTQYQEGTPISPINAATIYNVSAQSGQWTSRMNGAVIVSSNSNTVGFSSNPLLGGASGYYFNGDIAEVIAYNRILTSTERQTVGSYLFNKYQVTGIVAPPAPSGLAVADVSSTQANLTWTATPGIGVTYTIERQANSGAFVPVATVAGSLGFFDTGLVAGTTYTYQVQTSTYAGSSAFSNTASVTIPAGLTDFPLSGQQLWLRADAGIPDGLGSIESWLDQSPINNNAVQLTVANQPTLVVNAMNGRPALNFSSTTTQWLNLPSLLNGATGGDIFVVFQSATNSPSTSLELYKFGGNGAYLPGSDQNIYDDFMNSSQFEMGPAPTDLTVVNIYNASASSAGWTARLNGPPIYTSTANTFQVWPGQNTIGGSTYAFNGLISEVIIYNQVLTVQQRQIVMAYLQAKYVPTSLIPQTPVGLLTDVISTSDVNLTWAPQASIETFNIERSVDSGAWQTIATVPGPTSSYSDTNVPVSTVVKYRIQGVGYSGLSTPYGNEALAFLYPDEIDPNDGVPYWMDELLGIDPSAGNDAFPLYPIPPTPPTPPSENPTINTPPTVILLTPSEATLH